jgi:hypothetical protein
VVVVVVVVVVVTGLGAAGLDARSEADAGPSATPFEQPMVHRIPHNTRAPRVADEAFIV